MGITDGTVTAVSKILNNGNDSDRLNLVLVAEGFTTAQQPDFVIQCNAFIAALQAEPWYSILGSAINVHKLSVESDESGADSPAYCADGETGTGTYVDTYFDASFCKSGIWRCLSGDKSLVRDTLDIWLPQWHFAIVIVNTPDHGGCAGGNVCFSCIEPGWTGVALHEMGHTFGLGDEYHYWEGCTSGETGQDTAPAGEPGSPNVTTVTDPATLKWRHLLTPGVPVPTMENPNCTQCDDSPNILSSDLSIGLFEGAMYYHCGRYRPAYTCRMRSSSSGFCRVCIEAIAAHLGSYVPPTPVLEVVPASLEFGDVGKGLTLYLGFEVRNVRSGVPGAMDISITTPGSPFGLAPSSEVSFTLPAPVYESHTSHLIFVAFTAPETGGPDFNGSLTVTRTDDTSTAPVTVTFHGRAVDPPQVDTVLVVDRSGSMSGATGLYGATKQDISIEAANLYVSLLKDNDKIGLVRYNQHSDAGLGDILVNMTTAGDASTGSGRTAMRNALNTTNLFPDGSTSIGAGIITGSGVLDAGTADARAIVVLTDGMQNTIPDIPDGLAVVVSKSPAQRVFAVGLGLNQLEDRLDEIASVTNGFAQITGELVDEREFLLQKLYVQILSDVGDEAFVTDPRIVLHPGQAHSTPVYLSEVDIAADFIVVYRYSGIFPKYMHVYLEAPDGTKLNTADLIPLVASEVIEHQGHVCFRMQFPLYPDKPEFHTGAWKVWVENKWQKAEGTGRGVLYYSVMCKARSNFRLGGRVLQTEYKPGSVMQIILEPTQFGQPVSLHEAVKVQVTRPDGVVRELTLDCDAYGAYWGAFSDTALCGHYHVKTEVSATSADGHRITRYRHMTGIIFRHLVGGGEGGSDRCRRARAALRALQELIDHCCGEDQKYPNRTHQFTLMQRKQVLIEMLKEIQE